MTRSKQHHVFLCSGQGAQNPAMLPMILQTEKSHRLLGIASDLLGEDLQDVADKDTSFFTRNEISAVMVSLASIAAYEQLTNVSIAPEYMAGYSVGQWTAMYLAGMLPAETLLSVLIHRARLMNNTRAVSEGGMLAVIGLSRETINCVLANIEGYLTVANDNAPAQFTLSGEHAAIQAAEISLALFKPQRLIRVPVAGAWHSAMVMDAVKPFREYLDDIRLLPPSVPVISNVTAQPLPIDDVALKDDLALHLASSVRWAESIRYLIEQGAECFVELGYDNTLSKFGFFIDRTRQHLPWHQLLG